MIKSMKIHVKDNKLKAYLRNKMYSTKHFENILLILIDNDYKQNEGRNFDSLTNGAIMRAVITGNIGDKDKQAETEYMKEFYKDNELMNSLREVSRNLKIHNLVEQIKDVKKNYDGYFTKLKQGDSKAKPPKPKKLSRISSMTIFMDGYKSYTFKHRKKSKKNMLGINLHNKMKYTHVVHSSIEKVVGKLENIKNINVNYSNGNFYFLINYEYNTESLLPENIPKYAGLDIGVNNLTSIYIDDETSRSLIISGEKYKDYNSKFNRLIGELSYEISTNRNLAEEEKIGIDMEGEIKKLCSFRSFLYEKRNNFFHSEFHKVSKRILEYLKLCGVTHLYISKNLSRLKNSGECEMSSDAKQSFMQIPFIKLLENLEEKAHKFGIMVINVDEAYTSKTSSLSKDIYEVLDIVSSTGNIDDLANVFGGIRAKRGLFIDTTFIKAINADLNGGRNICILGVGAKNVLKNIQLFKLCNPLKLKCDSELLCITKAIALG